MFLSRILANFVLKFPNFRTFVAMTTSAAICCKFQWYSEIAWPWKPPHWCNILGSMSYISWVMANFLWEFSHFRYHGNRGRSDV